MKLTNTDIDLLEKWWVEKSRVNFLAYRRFMRRDYIDGWFMRDLAQTLQQFYIDMISRKRPILLISTPPQHGKSIAVTDFVSWVNGNSPRAKTIYSSYSERLGIRANTQLQRYFTSEKYKKIFPNLKISGENVVTRSHMLKRNSEIIEFADKCGNATDGYFRNTTIGGPITGESCDFAIIDDAVKGRAEANSPTISNRNWEWYTDDLKTRFSSYAGLLMIMTRWTTHDLIGRITGRMKGDPRVTVVNYPAIATKDEKYRKIGDSLFPELKDNEFLEGVKAEMYEPNWESLYQCSPTISGGNLFKDDWWYWWDVLPPLKYKFIVADTAQKTKKQNDFTSFQCWGYGIDNNIYMLDKFRAKLEAPILRRQAEIFYRKHDIPKSKVDDPILRGMYIEDKSSGVGLIQELKKKKLKIYEVPRNTDKVLRAQDASPYVESGRVYLNTKINGIDNLTKEAREFPNSEFDDDIDTLISAIEIAFINKKITSGLQSAMEMGD